VIRRLALAALALAAACGEGTIVEVEPVPADYTGWYRVDATGAVPGHGDTYRIIYASEEATTRGTADYVYPVGSVLVKEVRQRDGEQPGAVNYIAVMRKLRSADAPDGAELHSANPLDDSGWLFTYLADDIESDEEYRASCWETCHAAAPIDGAFLDYGQ